MAQQSVSGGPFPYPECLEPTNLLSLNLHVLQSQRTEELTVSPLAELMHLSF